MKGLKKKQKNNEVNDEGNELDRKLKPYAPPGGQSTAK